MQTVGVRRRSTQHSREKGTTMLALSAMFFIFAFIGWFICAMGIGALLEAIHASVDIQIPAVNLLRITIPKTNLPVSMPIALMLLCINFYSRTAFRSSDNGGLKIICVLSLILSWFLIATGLLVWGDFGPLLNMSNPLNAVQRFEVRNYIWFGVAIVLAILFTAFPPLTAAAWANRRSQRISNSQSAAPEI